MNLTKIARSIVAVLGGYALMGLLITLVQETWLGGVSFSESSTPVLLTGGFFTFVCAVVAGAVAAWVAGHHPIHHAAVMCLLVVVETTWLITSGRTKDPLWFDLMASGSLLVGLLIGASLLMRVRRTEPASAA